jgi:hypothetical protein
MTRALTRFEKREPVEIQQLAREAQRLSDAHLAPAGVPAHEHIADLDDRARAGFHEQLKADLESPKRRAHAQRTLAADDKKS